jgi:hypothetical protein
MTGSPIDATAPATTKTANARDVGVHSYIAR